MWCSTCRQDVPAIPAPHGETGKRCLRCNACMPETADAVVPEPTLASRFEGDAVERLLSRCPIDQDDWQLDADLRSAERLIKSCGREVRFDAANTTEGSANIPAAHLPGWDEIPAAAAVRTRRGEELPAKSRTGNLTWTILSLGIMAFVCGGVLMAWSYLGQRDDLWHIGLPFALVGQAGLIIGLIMQLDGLWQNNRDTSTSLHELDDQITELRSATTRVHSPARHSAQPFHVHFAEHANPNALLADIKGQLDSLSARLGKE